MFVSSFAALFLGLLFGAPCPDAVSHPGPVPSLWAQDGDSSEEDADGEEEEEVEEPVDPVEALKLVPGRRLPGQDCDQCFGGAKFDLCSTHAAQEAAAFDEVQAEWRGLDEFERMDLLVRIGNLTQKHANAPSPRVATYLVECWQTEKSELVQATAVTVLGWGQDAKIAIPPLLKLIKEKQKQNPKLRAKLQKLTDEIFEQSAITVDMSSVKSMTATLEVLQALIPLMKRAAKLAPQFVWEEHLLSAASRSIGSFPDKRCTKALLKAASTWDSKMGLSGLADGLLDNGTRSCVKAAIKGLDKLEREVHEVDRLLKRMRDSKAGQAPKGYKGGNVAWRSWYAEARMINVEGLEKAKMRAERLVRERLTLLRTHMEARGIKPPAPSKRGPYIRWNVWLGKNKDAFPSKVAGPTK